jgi:hypothetical protein
VADEWKRLFMKSKESSRKQAGMCRYVPSAGQGGEEIFQTNKNATDTSRDYEQSLHG